MQTDSVQNIGDEPTGNQKRKVKGYMFLNIQDHLDHNGELNCTQLAEYAASDLEYYLNDDLDIPEWIFDLAVDVEEQWRKDKED